MHRFKRSEAGRNRTERAGSAGDLVIGPLIQLAIGVWVFDEPFTPARSIGFAAIWLALVIYTLDGWRVSRLAPTPA